MKKNVKEGTWMSSWIDGTMESLAVALRVAQEEAFCSKVTREGKFVLSCGLSCSVRNTFKQRQFNRENWRVGEVPSLQNVHFYLYK